jgi:hypothetical protein
MLLIARRMPLWAQASSGPRLGVASGRFVRCDGRGGASELQGGQGKIGGFAALVQPLGGLWKIPKIIEMGKMQKRIRKNININHIVTFFMAAKCGIGPVFAIPRSRHFR